MTVPWDRRSSAETVGSESGLHGNGPWHHEGTFEIGPGTILFDYRVEGKIGQGGMGVVYAAVHPTIGKRAAIKVLKKELCKDELQIERFVDEARVVNQIGHPNIVDVFGFNQTPDGRVYFLMEWLKGETLYQRIHRAPFTLGDLIHVVRPLCRALDAAHGKGITHRDLKPENIFLVDVPNDRPHIKLLDFGLAKLRNDDHRNQHTAVGTIIGTPQYMAPEQAAGGEIDHRVDVYALGGIIFELLTGRPPFLADNAIEVVAKHVIEAPVAPSTLVPEIPPAVDELVLAMLAKEPQDRPTLSHVVKVIERVRWRPNIASVITNRPYVENGSHDSLEEEPTAQVDEDLSAMISPGPTISEQLELDKMAKTRAHPRPATPPGIAESLESKRTLEEAQVGRPPEDAPRETLSGTPVAPVAVAPSGPVRMPAPAQIPPTPTRFPTATPTGAKLEAAKAPPPSSPGPPRISIPGDQVIGDAIGEALAQAPAAPGDDLQEDKFVIRIKGKPPTTTGEHKSLLDSGTSPRLERRPPAEEPPRVQPSGTSTVIARSKPPVQWMVVAIAALVVVAIVVIVLLV